MGFALADQMGTLDRRMGRIKEEDPAHSKQSDFA